MKLSAEPSFAHALEVTNAISGLFGVAADTSPKPFNDSKGKIRDHAGWFMEAAGFSDRRACYKVAEGNGKNLDFKLYWVQKTSKRIISAVVALTPNFEDEPFFAHEPIGVDIIVPKEADRVVLVLSNKYAIRTLELHGALTVTQQEILAKWEGPFDFTKKAEVHGMIWQSFDLQPLNKKFYQEIAGFFAELVEHVSTKEIFDKKHARLFANRLIGRLIFCWFLRRKGIIADAHKYFETESIASSEYYRAKLEKLFFQVLNTPLEDRERQSGVKRDLFGKVETPKHLFSTDTETPYLNGGLFEPRPTDHFGETKINFPKDYFDRFFAALNQYNFTTDESTSTFQQVAIDPEMLGRIFENLLAEQTDEAGEQARKAKGAFYTPREIVDYMCRESMRAYLEGKLPDDNKRSHILELLLDKKEHEFDNRNYREDLTPYKKYLIDALDDAKILDPACGSGAFPMGMLQLMLSIYERLETRFDVYKTKLAIIKNNLYGVDIEPMAIDIARLRAWLSILVDEELNPKAKNMGIEPLPNLDFKFVCANTLLPLQTGKSAVMLGDNSTHLAKEIQAIRDEYFKTESITKKKRLKADFLSLQQQQEGLFGSSEKTKQLKTYLPFDSENSCQFFDAEFMFGVKGFNIVIGNPPYVSIWKIDDLLKKYFEKNYLSANGHYDLYIIFYERGLNLLKDGGVLSYITSNKWMAQSYGQGIRNIFLGYKIISLIDFSAYRVFKSAMVDTQITLIQKIQQRHDYDLNIYFHESGDVPRLDELKMTQINTKFFKLNEERNFKISLSVDKIKLLKKIQSLSIVMDDILYISKGAELHSTVNQIKKEEYIRDQFSPGLKMYIEGKYFDRYSINEIKYLSYEPEKHKAPVFPELFEAEKIIVKNIVGRSGIQAVLDTNGLYNNDALINAVPYYILRGLKYRQLKSVFTDEKISNSRKYSLRYMLGVLNCRVSSWYFAELFANGLHFYPRHLREVRVPIIDSPLQKEISTQIELIVDQIIVMKQSNSKADTDILENQIDHMVYELYGFTPAEIEIIENKKHFMKINELFRVGDVAHTLKGASDFLDRDNCQIVNITKESESIVLHLKRESDGEEGKSYLRVREEFNSIECQLLDAVFGLKSALGLTLNQLAELETGVNLEKSNGRLSIVQTTL